MSETGIIVLVLTVLLGPFIVHFLKYYFIDLAFEEQKLKISIEGSKKLKQIDHYKDMYETLGIQIQNIQEFVRETEFIKTAISEFGETFQLETFIQKKQERYRQCDKSYSNFRIALSKARPYITNIEYDYFYKITNDLNKIILGPPLKKIDDFYQKQEKMQKEITEFVLNKWEKEILLKFQTVLLTK